MIPSLTNRVRVLVVVALRVAMSTAGHAEKKRILVAANVAPDLADLTKTFPDLESRSRGVRRHSDVAEPEPLPADHPLWSMHNVTISPHAAGQMDGLEARQVELYRDNIERRGA